MKEFVSYKNQLLIAMPQLNDSEFNQTITLICEHNDQGAMGIVINQALNLSTTQLLGQMNIDYKEDCMDSSVLAGGPVQTDRGFVVHRSGKKWKSSILLDDDISITTSSDILHSIANNEVTEQTFIALGYAGWGPNQLENEISNNSWLNIPINSEIIFAKNISTRWNKAANSLGFNIEQLSFYSGNA